MTAVLDAGIGGLFVLKALLEKFPKEPFIYLADQKHFPYGDKDSSYIKALLKENVDFLTHQGAKRVIVACNTASAVLQEEKTYPVPVMGVISASLKQAQKKSLTNKVGLLATQGTVQSEAFLKQAEKNQMNLKIYQKACPRLAPFVEQGGWKLQVSDLKAPKNQNRNQEKQNVSSSSSITQKALFALLDQYIPPLLNKKVDTIIMGCTHYLYLKPFIQTYLKEGQKAVGPITPLIQELELIHHRVGGHATRAGNIDARRVGGDTIDATLIADRDADRDIVPSLSLSSAFRVSILTSGPHKEEYKKKCQKILQTTFDTTLK